jgi:hypothetical protein
VAQQILERFMNTELVDMGFVDAGGAQLSAEAETGHSQDLVNEFPTTTTET